MSKPDDYGNDELQVIKRSGVKEAVEFDKILQRVKTLSKEYDLKVNNSALVMKVIDQLYNGIETTKIDELTSEQCASMSSIHPDYNKLAGYIVVSNHQKNTNPLFSDVMKSLYFFNDKHGEHKPLISHELFVIVEKYGIMLDSMLVHERDYFIEYFGFKTLERSYLMRINNKPVERIQHLWLRVALGIHGDNMDKVRKTYEYMSQKYFTHATPTLYNAGTPHPQLSSCFLEAMEDDSIEGIYNTLKDCALISKWAGGIGLHIHNIRASGSHIRGTNGHSNGVVPMLKVFNNTAKYVDQCIVPETYIYTTQGPKKIQDVIGGETQIINENGESEVIENVLEHPYEGTIYCIETMHSLFKLHITDEHPVLCLSGNEKGVNYDVIKNRIEKNIIKNEWKDVKDLCEDDMLVYKIPKYEKDYETLTQDDCYFYGILLGDGYFENDNKNGHITLHRVTKRHLLDFCVEYFNKKCVKYSINENENTTRIRWNKNIVLPFRYSDVYDENKEKHITSRWLNLPMEKAKYIIKGLIHTDGSIYKEIVFDNTSIKLIESLRYLMLRLGVLTSGNIRDRRGESHDSHHGIIENKKISYSLKIPQTKEICDLLNLESIGKFFKFLRSDDYLYTRIKSITTSTYDGTLYDLQMKDVHSYTTHNGIIHNGGGRRNGSFAIYLEPWHADIELFLQMRKNHGDEELKARDLFYALWIPDLFMERVKSDGQWTLMCPDECPGLSDVYGDEFNKLYCEYEKSDKTRQTMKARDLWFQILDSQMETGTPYLLYKDACNKKSNQKNIGTIKSSNLCTEIVQYSDSNETAVCNLASIALANFVENGVFNYEKLHEITEIVIDNLNKVIDVNYYPIEKTRTSNMKHRPVGLGVSGLADVFIKMNLPFNCAEAKQINKHIFETIYHASLKTSCALAQEFGPYETFANSPASQGILQFDMWDVDPGQERYDWKSLKENIMTHGLRNSLLLAPMPTASTSQILGVNECIEPITSNIYNRRTIAGEFMVTNKYLMYDLIELNLWNDKVKNNIIANNGSIQQIDMIPQHIKDKYRTVWEIPMRDVIDMAVDRGAFICQSQSLNLWLEEPNYNTLTSMHFYGWSKGLKTGIYYLRRRARHQAQQFTIEPEKRETREGSIDESVCEMCSA